MMSMWTMGGVRTQRLAVQSREMRCDGKYEGPGSERGMHMRITCSLGVDLAVNRISATQECTWPLLGHYTFKAQGFKPSRRIDDRLINLAAGGQTVKHGNQAEHLGQASEIEMQVAFGPLVDIGCACKSASLWHVQLFVCCHFLCWSWSRTVSPTLLPGLLYFKSEWVVQFLDTVRSQVQTRSRSYLPAGPFIRAWIVLLRRQHHDASIRDRISIVRLTPCILYHAADPGHRHVFNSRPV